MTEPIENLYFNWLCAKAIRLENPTPSLTYWKLFRHLHNTEYIYLVAGDDSRAEDGLELRDEFITESRLDDDAFGEKYGCSVLEMLIAFARRARFMAGESVEFWFRKFLENLGLDQANDASTFSTEKLDDIINNFIWRTYRPSGLGGLFPMHNPPEDQREVEVWYQFCEYLVDQDWPL